MLHVYTDGSFIAPHGSWAFVALDKYLKNVVRIKSGLVTPATNNIAEFEAIKNALIVLDVKQIRIYTDSKYCIDTLTYLHRIWKRTNWMTSAGTPVKNRELIESILELMKGRKVTFQKVKGHSGNPYNTLCDFLAKSITVSAVNDLPLKVVDM